MLAATLLLLAALPQDLAAQGPVKLLDQAKTYELGQSRAALIEVERRIAEKAGRLGSSTNWETLLLDAFGTATPDAKRFMLRQLQRVGTPRSYDLAISLLDDDELRSHAFALLEKLPGVGLENRLAQVPQAERGDLVPLMRLLGVRARRDGIEFLSRQVQSDDRVIADVAALSLAQAAERSRELRSNAFIALKDVFDPSASSASWPVRIEVAARVVQLAGAESSQWFKPAFFAAAFDNAGASLQGAVLRAWVDSHVDTRGSVDRLRAWSGSSNARENAEVLAIVREARSPVLESLQSYWPGFRDQPEPGLITALGGRDEPGLSAFLHALASGSDLPQARAAIETLGRHGGADAVLPLLTAGVEGVDPLKPNVQDALLRLRGAEINAQIVAQARAAESSNALRAYAVRLLGDRMVAGQNALFVEYLDHEDPRVRTAALSALVSTGTDAEVGRLVQYIISGDTLGEVQIAGTAVEMILMRSDDPAQHSAHVVQSLGHSDHYADRYLMKLLGRIGGQESFEIVRALYEDTLDQHPLEILVAWPDDMPYDVLYQAAAERGISRRNGLRGLVNMQKFTAQRDVLPAVQRYEEIFTIEGLSHSQLSPFYEHLGTLAHPAALRLMRQQWSERPADKSRVDALLASAQLVASFDRAAAVAAVNALAEKTLNPQVKRQAGEAINVIEKDDGFIVNWLLAGPFYEEGVSPETLLEKPMAPEVPAQSAEIEWVATHLPLPPGLFDLRPVLERENSIGYALTWLWSERAQSVELQLGSDDGLRVILNDEVVHTNNAMRGHSYGSDKVVVQLKEGRNTLLLKISQGGGDWLFSCRVRGTDGFAPQGIRYAERASFTLPANQQVLPLMTGDGLDAWTHGEGKPAQWLATADYTEVRPGSGGLFTRERFGDALVHVSFWLPMPPPGSEGQARSNSGVYLQGRYEVQVLDSWGLPLAANGCGALYGMHTPAVNASRPPGVWQNYLIDFKEPRWDGDGNKVLPARASVWHNGVPIHTEAAFATQTGSGWPEGIAHGPLFLQDHGNGVRYRNIWLAPAEPGFEGAAGPGFQRIFDGQTLDGWVQRGGAADYAVVDGAIVGTTRPNTPNSFLCTEREYDNFVLELQFKIDNELNSGVQIRSHERDGGVVFGYQVEVDPAERSWSGGIYDESRRGWLDDLSDQPHARAALSRGHWNRMRVVADGHRIRTWINGEPCADLQDAADASGFIGLQVHGVGGRQEPLQVSWRNIRIREL